MPFCVSATDQKASPFLTSLIPVGKRLDQSANDITQPKADGLVLLGVVRGDPTKDAATCLS
jgi:hypothetical protein